MLSEVERQIALTLPSTALPLEPAESSLSEPSNDGSEDESDEQQPSRGRRQEWTGEQHIALFRSLSQHNPYAGGKGNIRDARTWKLILRDVGRRHAGGAGG
jgi:hypothetical protein